jgi:hypothetical protein
MIVNSVNGTATDRFLFEIRGALLYVTIHIKLLLHDAPAAITLQSGGLALLHLVFLENASKHEILFDDVHYPGAAPERVLEATDVRGPAANLLNFVILSILELILTIHSGVSVEPAVVNVSAHLVSGILDKEGRTV